LYLVALSRRFIEKQKKVQFFEKNSTNAKAIQGNARHKDGLGEALT
jgi:hypothetical protein